MIWRLITEVLAGRWLSRQRSNDLSYMTTSHKVAEETQLPRMGPDAHTKQLLKKVNRGRGWVSQLGLHQTDQQAPWFSSSFQHSLHTTIFFLSQNLWSDLQLCVKANSSSDTVLPLLPHCKCSMLDLSLLLDLRGSSKQQRPKMLFTGKVKGVLE